jgi:hypothetical protein
MVRYTINGADVGEMSAGFMFWKNSNFRREPAGEN